MGKNIENVTLGLYIKELRVKQGFTQSELCNILHISRQALSRWENGKVTPDQDSLKLLADIFNVSVETFELKMKTTTKLTVYPKVFFSSKIDQDHQQFKVIEIATSNLKGNPREYFFTQKEDASLNEIIPIGALLLCRYTDFVEENKIGIFVYRGIPLMRRISYSENDIILTSNNKAYPTIIADRKTVETIASVELMIIEGKDL